MNKIIIINGLIAGGKNTIGELLAKYFNENGTKSIFYDIDKEVTVLNPKDFWKNDAETLKIWLQARKNYAKKSNDNDAEITIIVGPFFTKAEINGFVKYVKAETLLYLYTLDTPIEVRIERNKHRVPSNDPQDIINQDANFQKMKDSLYGEIVKNDNTAEETVKKIVDLFEKKQGTIDQKNFAY